VSLGFSISPASETPIFRQIVLQVLRALALGKLGVGDQLPAVRVLAESLVVNPNTVARAYQELIRDGVAESRAGRGVFIVQARQVFSDEERERRLRAVAQPLCHEAWLLGTELATVETILRSEWEKLGSPGERPNKTGEEHE